MTEKRFKETVSTGIVTDTVTGKEYQCEMRIDDKLLELMNDLDEESTLLKKQLFNGKWYDIIWDFCDWLGYQGIAYETLYYGMNSDIDRLIKRYLEDKEWHNRKGDD